MSTLGNSPQFAKAFKLDTIVTDGSSSYALQNNGANQTTLIPETLIVSVNGVVQNPNTAYTISGATITFAEALASTDTIDFITAISESHAVATVSDNTISPAKLAPTLGLSNTPVRINTNSIDANITIDADKNAMVAGPVTINSSIVVNGTFTVV